jgi:RHS repeat-associated protein
LTKTDSTGTTTYVYDANNELITETSPGYTVNYEYDSNGNTVKRTQGTIITTYAYDFEDRLVVSQTGSEQVQYEYDADGIRTKATTNIGTTEYLVDKALEYPEVLEERDGANVLIVSYIHGDDLIRQKQGTSISYYHYDGQMSTRTLSDLSGAVTDSYVYDAFGNLINQSGSTLNEYLYAGEQYDPNLGAYYLRARYYLQGTGRFLTADVFQGNMIYPASLNLYSYTQNNPVIGRDPSGQRTLIEVKVTCGVLGALSVGALVAVGGYQLGEAKGAAIGFAAGAAVGWAIGWYLAGPYVYATFFASGGTALQRVEDQAVREVETNAEKLLRLSRELQKAASKVINKNNIEQIKTRVGDLARQISEGFGEAGQSVLKTVKMGWDFARFGSYGEQKYFWEQLINELKFWIKQG